MALTDSLISYYKFDESSGNASDSVGSNTLTNTSVSYTTGIINNGISTASGQYMDRSSAISTNTTNISMSLWVNLSSTSLKGCFFRQGNGGGSSGYGIGVGNVQYDGAGGLGNNLIILIDGVAWRSFGSIGGTGWKHIVVTRDSTTWRGYVDASVLGSTFTDSPGAVTAHTDVGRDNGQAAPFTGTIDELGFWEKQLNSSEITELYNSGSGLQYPFTATGTTNFLNLLGVGT